MKDASRNICHDLVLDVQRVTFAVNKVLVVLVLNAFLGLDVMQIGLALWR